MSICRYLVLLLVFIPLLSLVRAQKSIDLSFIHPPGSGIMRNYSIYEPAGFNPNKQNTLIIGFHPYGPGIWNANSWRDTLRSFIELTDVLLVCPDGGNNGRTDDQDDYNFTDALIDSLMTLYVLDPAKIFAIGFSEGGKATYEYVLNRDKKIKGMIAIGAAIDGVDFSSIIHKAKCNNFYLIHGDKDSPNSRYFPIKTDLLKHGALVDGILMANIGNTINFPSRNTILKMAFNFIDTSNCDITGFEKEEQGGFRLAPKYLSIGEKLVIYSGERKIRQIMIVDGNGNVLIRDESGMQPGRQMVVETTNWQRGLKICLVYYSDQIESVKVIAH